VTDVSVMLDDSDGDFPLDWGVAKPGNLERFAMNLTVFETEEQVTSVWSSLPAGLTHAAVVMGAGHLFKTPVPHIRNALACLRPVMEMLIVDATFLSPVMGDVCALYACFEHFTRIGTLRVHINAFGTHEEGGAACNVSNWASIVSLGSICEHYTLALDDGNYINQRGGLFYAHLHTEVLRIASTESVRSFELRGCRGITVGQSREVAAVLERRKSPMCLFMNGCGLRGRISCGMSEFVCTVAPDRGEAPSWHWSRTKAASR
jgi:hypothetical protein